MTRTKRGLLAALLLGAVCAPALAQSGGGRALQLVVPYGPGNGVDMLAREFAALLRSPSGVAAVVENREGAAGVVGSSFVARAAADGNTLLFAASPPFSTAPWTQSTPPYDPSASFVPVARLGVVPMVLITSTRASFTTFAQMKQYIAAHDDQATYAHSGNGSPGQVYVELLKQAAQMPTLRAIPYKSTGQAMTDLISGTVLVSMASYPATLGHLKAGTVRLLAVGSTQRLKDYPDVPTMGELIGQPEFEAGVWYGVLAPAGTPAERVNQLHADFAKAFTAPAVTAFMARSNIVPKLMTPAEFTLALRKDVEAMRRLVSVTPTQ